jgi:hypothetical protein
MKKHPVFGVSDNMNPHRDLEAFRGFRLYGLKLVGLQSLVQECRSCFKDNKTLRTTICFKSPDQEHRLSSLAHLELLKNKRFKNDGSGGISESQMLDVRMKKRT